MFVNVWSHALWSGSWKNSKCLQMSEEKIHSPRQQRLQVNSLITSCCLHLWAESGAGDKPAGRQTISEQNVTRQWCSWALITLRHKLNNENTLHVLFCCFIMFGEKSAGVLFLSLTVGFLFYDTVFMIIVSFCNKRRKTCQIQLKLEHKEVKNIISTNSLSLNLEFVPSSVSRTCKLIFSCSEGKQTQVVFITCFNGW